MSTRLRHGEVRLPYTNRWYRNLGPSSVRPGSVHLEAVDGSYDVHVPPEHLIAPNVRSTDHDTSRAAAAMQTPTKVRSEHRLVLELLRWEPLTDFDLAERASQALGRKVKSVSVGKRRGELRDMGLVADSGLRGKSDTGTKAIRWALTEAGVREVAA